MTDTHTDRQTDRQVNGQTDEAERQTLENGENEHKETVDNYCSQKQTRTDYCQYRKMAKTNPHLIFKQMFFPLIAQMFFPFDLIMELHVGKDFVNGCFRKAFNFTILRN